MDPSSYDGFDQTKNEGDFNDYKEESKSTIGIYSKVQSDDSQPAFLNIGLAQEGEENFRNSDISIDFVIDNANNIVTIGTINDGDGSTTAYISKIDSTGDLIWNKTLEGVNQAVQVVLDQENNLFFAGNTQDGTSFVPSPNAINTTTNGFDDNILIKFNPNGEILWSTFWGGADRDIVTEIGRASCRERV